MKMHHRQTRAYNIASKYIGVKEIKGPDDNQQIVKWFAQVGHSWVDNDETAWCAAFLGACLEDAGLKSTRALNARSYLDWGVPVMKHEARPGDILVFWRVSPSSWQGHVGFYVAESQAQYHVLGGNQSDMVRKSWYSKKQLLGIRRYPAPLGEIEDGCWTRFMRSAISGGDSKLRNAR